MGEIEQGLSYHITQPISTPLLYVDDVHFSSFSASVNE